MSSIYLVRKSPRLQELKRREMKKSLSNYTKQRPTVFDNLPLAIIKHSIFPYLDYNSRNSLNLCLPPWDRISTRIPRHKIQEHHVAVCTAKVASILNSLNYSSTYTESDIFGEEVVREARLTRLIQMLSLFMQDDYFTIYRGSLRFRNMFHLKLEEFLNMTNDGNYSGETFELLTSTCLSLSEKINSNKKPMTTFIKSGAYISQ
jgi:hypothetical protein